MPKIIKYDEVKNLFDEKKYQLLTKEYTGYDQKLQYICVCGKPCETTYTSMKTGRISCIDCQLKRNKEKNLEKYGVDHPSKTKEFQEKIKETKNKKRVENPDYDKEIQEKVMKTNLEKRGVPYPLMSKEAQAKAKQTNLEKRGVEFAAQSEEVKDKIKKTNLEKYGETSAMKNKTVHDKGKATNLKKYGVENPFQSEVCKEKAKKTNMEKLGVEFAAQSKEVKDKIKETCIEKYGVDNPMKNKEVQDKGKATNIARRGVANVMQDKAVYDKANNSFKKKEYIFPKGKKIMLQGYENYALDILIKDGYDEEDVLIDSKRIPTIDYELEDGTHFFYPDIYIKSEKKFVEVKSTYTYSKFENKNLEKLKQTNHLNLEYWIFEKYGKNRKILKSKDY